jgi:predicted transcriptional regulator
MNTRRFKEELSEYFKKTRDTAKNLSLRSGVDCPTISKIKGGKVDPRESTILRLRNAFLSVLDN